MPLGRGVLPGFLIGSTMGLPLHAPLPAQAPSGSELEGPWSGAVVLPGTELAFSVTFEMTDGVLSGTLDIPSQALGLALSNISHGDGRVHFEYEATIGTAVWDGALEGDSISGGFKQGPATGTFSITRGVADAAPAWAPAEPIPYRMEEISFENGEIHLEGTLTLPEGDGPFPAAVMITGSGAQNRNEELLGFPVFHVIADHLTREGIAIYRYDDRGVGGSTGNVTSSTTEDFAGDVIAAIARISEHPDIDSDRVGLIGHSEGGVVAPLAASRSDAVKFTVLLAGTSVPGDEIIYEQGALISRAAGADEEDIAWTVDFQRRLFAAVEAGEDLQSFRDELDAAIRDGLDQLEGDERPEIEDMDAFVEQRIQQQMSPVQSPWFRFFLSYDPAPALRLTRVPVLALFGDLDLQVPPHQNRGPMAEALGGNPDVTIEVIPGANHLFQEATTGSPTEYGTLEKAFVDGFLEKIADWILARFGD